MGLLLVQLKLPFQLGEGMLESFQILREWTRNASEFEESGVLKAIFASQERKELLLYTS